MSVPWADDAEEDGGWLLVAGLHPRVCTAVWPVLGLRGWVTGSCPAGTTSSSYRNCIERLTESKARNTDNREPEVEQLTVLISALREEEISADHSAAIALVQL